MPKYVISHIGYGRDAGAGDPLVARAACEYAAENSVEAMDAGRALVAALLGNDGRAEHTAPLPLRDASDGATARLAGALAVEVRYVERIAE